MERVAGKRKKITGLGNGAVPGEGGRSSLPPGGGAVGVEGACGGTRISAPLGGLVLVLVSQSWSKSCNLCYVELRELSLLLRNYPGKVVCFYANSKDE